ncbi:MAG: GTPase, partial [Deltaproteobacteria bacterium]
VRDGIAALIVGKSNSGKSSLLNCLLNEKRSIVTHIAGTTRDIIEETVNIEGLAVRLLDTAGIRHTHDLVELEGIERALDSIPSADLILFVHDPTRSFDENDKRILNAVSGKRVLVICNKCDLAPKGEMPTELSSLPKCQVSALSGAGIGDLRRAIRNTFISHGDLDSRDFAMISKARHLDALQSAQVAIANFLEGLNASHEVEILAIDLREALYSIGQVTGETSNEDLLDIIFSSFCIGK